MRGRAWAGQYELAIEMAPALLRVSGRHQWVLGTLAWTYGKAGHAEQARAVCDEMEGRSRHEFVSPFWLATAAASSGLMDQAIHRARRAVADRDPIVVWGRVIPFWDTIRADPRFEEVTRGVWDRRGAHPING
jgi:hypothetical protein